MVRNILFDLDGTLLVMKDQELFVKLYLEALCRRFCPVLGVSPKELSHAIWASTEKMFLNDGSSLNREVFWRSFAEIMGKDILERESEFDDFYANEFVYAKQATGVNPYALKAVQTLKEKGYRLILATNPVFPTVATVNRLSWAGIPKDMFELITVYDNSSFCKPNPDYYREIMSKLSILPRDYLMVGNDVDEDMITDNIGMETYLVTDCLENKNNKDYSHFRQGSMEDFYIFAKAMPKVEA